MPGPTLPNMSLVQGAPGSDVGTWGALLNSDLATIDAHNHGPGSGARVPTAGLNINGDLTFSSLYGITNMQRVSFSAVAALSSNNRSLFVSSADNELYWRTNSGTNVKLTSGTALNVAAFAGGIGGDYTAVSAALNFDDSGLRYTFRKGGGLNWARIATGEVRIFETDTTDAAFVGLAAPAALAGSYTLTWPTALPVSTLIAQVSSAGIISFSNTVASAATFSGLITAQAGLTASVNQNLTVSGTGELKHGSRSLIVSAAAFSPGNNYATASITLNTQSGIWSMNTAPNDMLSGDVPLMAGDRIQSLNWVYDKNTSAANMVFELRTRNGVTVTVRDTVTDSSAGGVGSSRTPNYTIAPGDAVYLHVTSSNSLHRFMHCQVVWDRP